MLTLYLIRHGEIVSNIKKIYAGWSEEKLTQRGCQQAKEAGRKLALFNINRIYTSPLKRTVQTANIIGLLLNQKPILEENFKELKLGIWEGLSEKEISRRFSEEWAVWNKRPTQLVLENRETLNELLERVLRGVKKIKAGCMDGSALIVTHVAIIRVLLLHIRKMDLDLYRSIPVSNGKIFKIHDDQLR